MYWDFKGYKNFVNFTVFQFLEFIIRDSKMSSIHLFFKLNLNFFVNLRQLLEFLFFDIIFLLVIINADILFLFKCLYLPTIDGCLANLCYAGLKFLVSFTRSEFFFGSPFIYFFRNYLLFK